MTEQPPVDELPERSPTTASHDPATPEALVEFMSGQWAPEPEADLRPLARAPFCARRRQALSDRFPGEWLVVPTGTLKVRANDTDYPFRPGSDFYWLCGSDEPDSVLVLEPADGGHHATLFTEPRADRRGPQFFTDRRYGELWVGPRLGLRETRQLLDVDCAPLGELTNTLKRVESAPVRVLRGVDAGVDDIVAAAPAAEGETHPDAELATALSELRLVKDEHEVTMLDEAVAATVRAFEDVVRALPAAKATTERWLEGTFFRRARTEGNDVGYGSIVACGHHACTLHWVRNDGPVRDGELMLLDAGVESTELYTADVTRTLPISGRWTTEQRQVYELVLAAQRAAVAEVSPGSAFLDPHRAAMRVLVDGLVGMGVLTVPAEEAMAEDKVLYRRWTLHGVSHMLGLDVHDCAEARNEEYRNATLREGMVLTVEPGLYFQPGDLTVPERYRGIGVRIEDDVVVTADGCRNLSAALPTDPDEIEAWMAALQGSSRQ